MNNSLLNRKIYNLVKDVLKIKDLSMSDNYNLDKTGDYIYLTHWIDIQEVDIKDIENIKRSILAEDVKIGLQKFEEGTTKLYIEFKMHRNNYLKN